MRTYRTWIGLLVVLLAGCMGETSSTPGSDAKTPPPGSDGYIPPGGDPFAPCTDPVACCDTAHTTCWGDPDKGLVCKCNGLWDCSVNPKKCEQETPVPPGGFGGWECVWTVGVYTCTGTPPSAPPGGGGWTCKQQGGKWVCTHTPPNPTNNPSGAGTWNCTVEKEFGKLVCTRDTPPDAGVKKPDITSPPPPPPKTETNCTDGIDNDGDGLVDSKDPDCPAVPPTGQCPPGQECCDGKDNDGDGKIDEGNVCGNLPPTEPCPPGAYQVCDCYCGVHRKCKADGTWGPCIVDGQSCQVAQITTQAQCGATGYCDYGKCVPGKFGLGSQCVSHNDCAVGKICDLGYCITDPYKPWKCP
jgi:hypothetical protein